MPIEAANQFLSQDHSLEAAFEVPKRMHFMIGSSLEQVRRADFERVALATSDYYTAGVAYLANRGHDASIQEIGHALWGATNRQRVLTVLTDNMKRAALELGVPRQTALSGFSKNDEPHVLFMGRQQGIELIEAACVLLPREFVVRAQNNPVEALASVAWIGSQVRDMVNGRLQIDGYNITTRAAAFEAHFLLNALSCTEGVELSANSKALLAKYPRGIRSLSSDKLYVVGAWDKPSNPNLN